MARLPYVIPEDIDDPEMREWLEKSMAEGKPGPEIQSLRAHSPGVMRSFTMSRQWLFHSGAVDHDLKELLRGYIAVSAGCDYCSNQGTSKDWLTDAAKMDSILHHAKSDEHTPREKAALAYADVIMWDPTSADDALWARLDEHFSPEEVVELGYWVGFTFGGQRWLKTLGAVQGELDVAIAERSVPADA